ncbi:hypothetical protein NQ784_03720 [Acinetobacter baumannii]|nr:hypothetical protein [Acinetobacter baumannii]
MDKCREEFNREFNKHHAYHAAYSDDYKRGAKWGFQHQQAKVEELQRRNQMLNDSTLGMGSNQIRDTDLINQQASTLFRLREFIYGSGDLREYSDEELLEHQRTLKAIVTGEQALKGEG